MHSHIVKPRQDEDYYVEWSSVVEGPTFHGTRAEMVAYGERNWPSVVSERITRADATSCSALWYEPSWSDDEAYILMQAGWFPRSRMREVVAAFLDAGENVRDPRVLALLEPFEPDPVSAKSGRDRVMPTTDEARAEAERRYPKRPYVETSYVQLAFVAGAEWERNRPISVYQVNDAALALYKLDHPAYESDTFEDVPLLSTVQHYRERARAALEAARGTKR